MFDINYVEQLQTQKSKLYQQISEHPEKEQELAEEYFSIEQEITNHFKLHNSKSVEGKILMETVHETILGVGSGNPYLKLELTDNYIIKYEGKKLTNQQIFDLSPLSNCRCRVINGIIADMCFGHYRQLSFNQKKLVDRMMQTVRLNY